MMVGLMMGEHAGTVIEGTVREGIIRPIGTRGAFDIGPREEREREKKRIVMTFHFTASIHTVFIALVEFDFSELVIILLFLVTYLLNFLITGMEKFDIDNAVLVTIL